MKSALLAALWLGIFSTVALADAPATLTLADLANRPDRWPAAVSMNQDIQFNSGAVVHQTDKLQILKFDGSQLILSTTSNIRFQAKPEDTNLLDAANQAWSALTPAQRAIDSTSLAADETLWPVQLTLSQPVVYPQWGTIPAGASVTLYDVSAKGVDIDWPNSPNRITINVAQTDLISRARQLVLVDPDKRPSRIAAAIDGIMVDSDGKPYHDPNLQSKNISPSTLAPAGALPVRPSPPTSSNLPTMRSPSIPNWPSSCLTRTRPTPTCSRI